MLKRTGIYSGITGLVILIIIGLFKFFESKVLKENELASVVLKATEKRKAIIDFRHHTLTTITKDKKNEIIKFKSGLRTAVITESTDGTIAVYAPEAGLVFEPGLSAFYSNHYTHLGIDIQWAYWKRLGLSTGMGMTVLNDTIDIDLYPIALNFNPPFNWTPNTNIFIGINADKDFVAGTSVKF